MLKQAGILVLRDILSGEGGFVSCLQMKYKLNDRTLVVDLGLTERFLAAGVTIP